MKETMKENIADTVEKVTPLAVAELEDKGVMGLYLGGSALSSDFLPWSDIDLYGIVEDAFDFDGEKVIIQKLNDIEQRLLYLERVFYGNR